VVRWYLDVLVTPKSLEMAIDGLGCILWPSFLHSCQEQADCWLNEFSKQY
jgi:hypothetical protein